MATKHEVCWMWMELIYGVGSSQFWKDRQGYDTIEEFVKALIAGKVKADPKVYSRMKAVGHREAVERLDKADELGQRYVCWDSTDYPAGLRSLSDAPGILFYRGALELLNERVVLDIVGARSPSDHSVQTCGRLCEELVGRGGLPAGGFSQGIDQTVNGACIELGAPSAMVFAYPLEYDYPAGSQRLKEKILEHGVIISEMGPGMNPGITAFRQRNRLSVAISEAVVYIEAGEKSHSFDHSEKARSMGRPVFVVPPGDIYDPRYFGQTKLLRQGGRILLGVDDIAEYLSQKGDYRLGKVGDTVEVFEKVYKKPAPEKTGRSSGKRTAKAEKPELSGAKVKERSSEPRGEVKAVPKAEPRALPEGLSEVQVKLVELLRGRGPVSSETLREELGLRYQDMVPKLRDLELRGIVTVDSRGLVELAGD